MKLETENVKETEASAELIRELMADDARRGNWLIGRKLCANVGKRLMIWRISRRLCAGPTMPHRM